MLVEGLPPDSATIRSVGSPATDWTLDQYMLASIFDGVRVLAWQWSGGKRKNRPEPLERPGARARAASRRTQLTVDELAERLHEMRDRIAADEQDETGDDVEG